MKQVNNLLSKVGTDKVLHFAIGALIDALLLPFGIRYTIIGIFVVWLLSCVKELLDSFEEGNRCDWIDVLYSVAGAAAMCGYYYCVI